MKQPDTFDGSDPKKLNNFILLCNLYFRNNSAYSDGGAKITFALTLLWGTALEFFKPLLMSNDPLAWENDWEEFIKLLRSQFGRIDPTADAVDSIDRTSTVGWIINYSISDDGVSVGIVKSGCHFLRVIINGVNSKTLRWSTHSYKIEILWKSGRGLEAEGERCLRKKLASKTQPHRRASQ